MLVKLENGRKKLEETVAAGKSNPLEGVQERTQHWILAWSNLTEDGTLVYKKKEVTQVRQKALQVAAKKDWVSFSPIEKTIKLRKLSVTLNTQDASVVLVLRCRGNMVF
jgi:hypothetical protein